MKAQFKMCKYVLQSLDTSQVKNTSFGGIQVNLEAPQQQQRKQSFSNY